MPLRVLWVLAAVVLAGGWWCPTARGHDEADRESVAEQEKRLEKELTPEQWQQREQEKAKLKVMIWASAMILVLFCGGLILLTILWAARFRKLRDRKRARPTDATDLWSQYRLKEEGWEDPKS